VWDKERIISLVSCRKLNEALNTLKAQLGLVNDPQIAVTPAWWPFLPTLPFRIEVRVQ
jgi:hypothetical protein